MTTASVFVESDGTPTRAIPGHPAQTPGQPGTARCRYPAIPVWWWNGFRVRRI